MPDIPAITVLKDGTEVRTVPVSYRVTAWPADLDDNIDADQWSVTVADRGHGLWAVLRGGGSGGPCLSSTGRWEFEPIPSERDDAWRETHRFRLDRALELAREIAPDIIINGMTTMQVIARHRQQEKRDG